MIRAKFTVTQLVKTIYGTQEGASYQTVTLEPRYDQSIPEDVRFLIATPTGKMEMRIDNPVALEQFVPGKAFYVDFTLVEQMSTSSSRNIQIQLSGDTTLEVIQSALDNDVSPGMSVIQTLSSGANTITAPVVSGLVVTGLTIIPPSGNINLITLKGVAGDTGISLHLTDPTSIGLDTTFVSLVLNATSEVVGVRLIWS